MKIVLITTEISPHCLGGGAGSFNEELIKFFENKNVNYKVITYNFTKVTNENPNFIFIKVPKKLPLIGGIFNSIYFSYKSKKILGKMSYDIILTDDFGGNLFFYKNIKKIKIVFAHTTIEHILNLNFKLTKKIRDFFEGLYYSFIEKKSLNNSDYILAPTKYAYNIIEKLVGKKISNFITPLGLENLFLKKEKLNKSIKTIIWAGGVSERKGIKRMLNIQNEINKVDNNIKLILIATSNHDYIYEYIKKNNLNINLELLGFLPRKELYNKYIESDLLLLTSYSENFPMILLESVMIKLPISFIKNGGAETIWDNKEALIFKKEESYQNIANKILNISSDTLNENRTNAFDKYISNFTQEKSMSNILNIIKTIYEKKS